MKKIMAFLMSAALCLGMLPAQISAAEGGENIALGKTVIASSTLGGYDPKSVIDGNNRTIWARGNLAAGEYIMVDLGEPYRITSVALQTRLDIDDKNYRTRVALEFSNTPDFSVKERIIAMGDDPLPFGAAAEVTPSKTPYRYVRAVKLDTFIFVLAEFEIYGYIPDPNALEVGADVIGSRQEGAVSLLSSLGLIGNIGEDVFGVDHLMTRSDAAQTLANTFGASHGFTKAVPFRDVDVLHKDFDGIAAAYYMGYITGDENSLFRPDDYITKTELLLMTMRAMGYAHRYDNNTARILQEAQRMGLLKNVQTEELSEPISRGDASAVLYNALLAPSFTMTTLEGETMHFENGENLLRRRFGITLKEGIVEETTITRLDGMEKKGKSAVSLSGDAMIDPNKLLDAYLGKRVIVVVDEDEPDTVMLAWETDKNEEIVIADSKLASTQADMESGRIAARDENGREEKYLLDKEIFVIANGVANPYYEASDFDVKNGYIRLLDNDRDGVYEVAFLETYTLHYLSGAFSDEKELTIVDSNNVRKTLQRESLKVTDVNGNTQSVGKVGKDSVIKLFETPDGENCRIILYKPTEGQIEEMSDEGAAIDGASYDFSVFYRENMPQPAPKAGDYVSAYIDEADEILWLEPNTEANESQWTIAFSQKAGFAKGLDPDIKFRLFNEKGTWVEYLVADTVRVDGYTMKKAELKDLMEASVNAGTHLYEKTFLRYKVNDKSQLSAIDTTRKTERETERSFTKMEQNIVSGLYSPEASSFWYQHEMISPAKNDTPTFVIPVVNNEYTTSSDYDSLYRVSTVVSVAGNRSSQAQNLEQYMPDEFGYPACFVKKESYAEAAAGSMIFAVTSENAPFMVVERVTAAVSSEGDVGLKISGKNLSTQQDVSFLAEDTLEFIEASRLFREKSDCLGRSNMVDVAKLLNLSEAERKIYIRKISEIGYGDIIRYEMQTTTARAVERVFDYDAAALPQSESSQIVWYAVNGTYPEHYIAFNRFQLGTITDITKETFTLSTFAGKSEMYLQSAVPKILVCSADGKNPKVLEKKELCEFSGDNYRVILHSYNATPKIAVVYEYSR